MTYNYNFFHGHSDVLFKIPLILKFSQQLIHIGTSNFIAQFLMIAAMIVTMIAKMILTMIAAKIATMIATMVRTMGST